jgi:hypothetical protein
MCAELPGTGQVSVTLGKVATISPLVAQTLPRDLLKCILGIAAVHMAARNPGNRPVERLALEAKVCLFESINSAFQQPERQRADVLFACTHLMFAMHVYTCRFSPDSGIY